MQTIYRFIHGFEVGLALWGLMVLFSGITPFPGRRWVRGFRARLLALAAILPLPLASLSGYMWAAAVAHFGGQFSLEEITLQGIIFEGCVLALALSAIYFYGLRWAQAATVQGDSHQLRSLPETSGESQEDLSGIG